MYTFHSINELLNALVLGKELLGQMFGKRKSFDYRYDQAIEVLEESKVDSLIEKGVIINEYITLVKVIYSSSHILNSDIAIMGRKAWD